MANESRVATHEENGQRTSAIALSSLAQSRVDRGCLTERTFRVPIRSKQVNNHAALRTELIVALEDSVQEAT